MTEIINLLDYVKNKQLRKIAQAQLQNEDQGQSLGQSQNQKLSKDVAQFTAVDVLAKERAEKAHLEMHLIELLLEDSKVQKHLAVECRKEMELQIIGFDDSRFSSDEIVYLESVIQSTIAAKLLMNTLATYF